MPDIRLRDDPIMDSSHTPLTLCVLLWAHEGLEDALVAYEDRVRTACTARCGPHAARPV
ncbi:hypothetical protein ABIB56_002630 [Glaciihabitans sp. UYNi722]